MMNPSGIAVRGAGACALALALLCPAQAAPVVEMTAASSATGFDLTVRAQDVVDLFAYQFTLNFNPSLLKATAQAEGSFLSTAGTTFFRPGDIDNLAGSLTFVLGTLTGPIGGVSGSGDLARFSFSVQQAGLATFTLSEVVLLDSAGSELSADVRSLVTAVPEPSTYLMFALGLAAVLGAGSFKRRTA